MIETSVFQVFEVFWQWSAYSSGIFPYWREPFAPPPPFWGGGGGGYVPFFHDSERPECTEQQWNDLELYSGQIPSVLFVEVV